MVLNPHIPWCISRVRLCQRVRFGSFSESLCPKELPKKINILHLDKAEWKDENWDHTSLCTLLENAFAILAIGLGIRFAFHVEFEELMKN